MRRHSNKPEILHEIKKLGYYQNGEIFKVSIKFAFTLGWIERVNCSFQNSSQKNVYQLQHKENIDDYAIFEAIIVLKTSAIYHYHFSFEANGKFQYYKKLNLTGKTSISVEENWKLSVGFDVPSWAEGATMYHIFVDRFKRSNNSNLKYMPNRLIHGRWNETPIIGATYSGKWNIDFFGGDLPGIIEKIPYLKSLNIDILYLSPICLSQSNHRYDTADYELVDNYAGSNEDLKELCQVAHNNGMRVILDSVFNHTGNDSKYFNEFGTFNTIGAYQSKDSPYYNFYKKHWFQGKIYFSYWWGMKNLPECDSSSEEWVEFICGKNGIIDKWFSYGIDGLRLDVADELSDEFIEKIVKAAKRNKPDSLILGEVWKNPMRMNRGYISSGHGMHSVMNYLLMDALIRYYKYTDVNKLDGIIKEIMSEYPDGTIHCLMNFTSTHDISRAIEIFATNSFQEYGEWAWNLLDESLETARTHNLSETEYYYGKIILKSYITVLAFLPGIFSIFYGDEVGVKGIGNLANRATFPWNNMDEDLLKYFRNICQLRHDNVFLKNANFEVLKITEEYFSFKRYDDNNTIIVYASRSHHPVKIKENYSNMDIIFSLNSSLKIYLAPYGAIVLKC